MRVRRTFDHFELQEVLGAGGMGSVYRALDTNLNRSVALKLLRKEFSEDAEFVAQFENEASITASINHPNVVKVYSAGNDHGLIYIAMELVDKGSLDDLMTLQGKVGELQVLEVGIQIAQGLNAAYQRGLIHRDVKPGNILFADAHTAKIVDFGLAVLQEHAGKVGGEVWGTPYYVAPEKLDNSPEDFRSDIYSLGGTLFHALAGRPPFEAETASMVALKHLKSQAVSLQAFAPEVSTATAFVINKTLSKDPDDRYSSYEELVEHLQYARSELVAAVARGPQRRARVQLESEETHRALSWITFGMVAVVVLGGVILFTMRDRIFGEERKPDTRVEDTRKAQTSFLPAYNAARQRLIKGEYRPAAVAFRELAEKPDVPQPLLNWISLHEGLAMLLDGREQDARAVFSEIEKRGPVSQLPGERELSKFFIELSREMTSSRVVAPAAAKDYEKTNSEAIGLLLLALKDWEMGHFEEAVALFRQYQSSTPQGPHAWAAEYKDLAAPYISDFSVYRENTEALKPADTVEARRTSLASLRIGREGLKLSGKLAGIFDDAIKSLDTGLREAEEHETKKQAEEEAADAPTLAELRAKIATLTRDYKFSEARAAAAASRLISAKGKAEQEMLTLKMDALVKFRTGLITDLPAANCTTPVARRSAAPVPAGTVRATEARVEIITPYGLLPIPWADVAPESLYNVGRALLKPGGDAAAFADRQWNLGVYALSIGKRTEAETLLTAAAEAKDAYKAALPSLLQSSK